MKVFLDTIGCRLNQSEIERMAGQLRAQGHQIVDQATDADMVVVNTCSVTSEAAADSRQRIRQAARAGNSHIVVTGCWATLEPDVAASLPGVEKVIGNPQKDHLVAQVLNLSQEVFDLEPLARQPLPGLHQRTRAFIKVQDGCDNFCTFCVTRLARGRGRSQTAQEVLEDIRTARAGGVQEVVLTGVHLGSWGQDFKPQDHLRRLIQLILDETDVPRVRLSSLEPWDLDEDFFSLWQNARMCRHLHLPLQSGSEATLRRMARKTTPSSFAHLVETARQVCPDMAVATDLIVGFPGESEAEFSESLEFVRRMDFAAGHVFPYSVRAGTAASRHPDQVPLPERKERGAAMRAVLAESAHRFQQRFLGETVEVLWESATQLGPDGWRMQGLSGNYLRVDAETPRPQWNEIHRVKLDALLPDGLHGVIETGSAD